MIKDRFIALAFNEFPAGPQHRIMQRANELAVANQSRAMPFPKVDVGFAELLDTIRADATQRELDLIYATNLYQQAWLTLHVTMATLNEKVPPGEEADVRKMFETLRRLKMEHLLTDGLSKKWVRWLNKP